MTVLIASFSQTTWPDMRMYAGVCVHESGSQKGPVISQWFPTFYEHDPKIYNLTFHEPVKNVMTFWGKILITLWRSPLFLK